MICNIVPQVEAVGNQLSNVEQSDPVQFKKELKFDWIYVFYDPSDEDMKYLGKSVYQILNYRIYNIKLIPIKSLGELQSKLNEKPWIGIYAFNSNLTGIFINQKFYQWEDYYGVLALHQDTKHIVGMGNTISLKSIYPDGNKAEFIYDSDADQIDLLLLVLYDIWTVSEIANQRALIEPEYNATAVDLTLMATKLYADNFNTFINVNFQPIKPIGQIDEVDREIRTQKMYEKHAPQIEPTYYHKEENGSLTEIPANEIDQTFQPTVKLSKVSELDEGDFILGEVPFLSGLRGPIGEIVDILLPLLGGGDGSSVLSIPSSIMESIKDSFGQIQSIIGLVSDFSAESALKTLLDILAEEFPFIDELKPFLEIFTKALFNMRGGIDDISEVIFEILNAVLEQILPDSIGDIVGTVLNVGQDLWDEIDAVVSEGKSVFDAMVSFFSGNVMKGILNKTLVSSLGISQAQATELVNKFVPFIKSTISFLVSFDTDTLIETLTGPLMQTVLGSLDTLQIDGLEKIGKVIKLGFKVVDLADEFNIESVVDVLKEAILIFIDNEDIQGDVEKLAQKIMKIVQNFKEGAFSSISNFKDHVINTLSESLASKVTAETKELFADIMTMVCGIYNEGFDPTELPNIFDLAEEIIDYLNMDSSLANTLKGAINNLVKPVLGIIGHLTGSEGLKQMLPADLFSTSNLMEAIPNIIKTVLEYIDTDDLLDGLPDVDTIINTFGQIASGIMGVVDAAKGKSFTGVLKSIWMSVGSVITLIPPFDGIPLDAIFKLFQSFFPEQFGLSLENAPNPTEVVQEIMEIASSFLDSSTQDILSNFLNMAMNLKGLFTDGLDWIVGKILDWVGGMLEPILNDIESSLMDILGGTGDLLGYHGTLPIGLGDWSLFDLKIDLGIQANFNIDITPLLELVKSMILDARSTFSLDNIDDFFKTIFSMFEISPQFYAELGVSGLDTESNSFMKFLLESLGLELSFSGYAKFVMNLFTFKGGIFEWEDFFHVVEWAFGLKVELGKTFTLLDFLTGGVGGGALNAIAKFLGLDSINVRVWIGLSLDIVKKAGSATQPEVSTLTVVITLGCAVTIGIDLLIVGIKLIGSLEIILTFFQDFAAAAPMKITLRLVLTFKIELKFLFSTTTKTWTWEPGGPWDLSPNKGDPEYEKSGVGFDSDGDGLGDDYETDIPGLDPNNPDTDGDGANDKLEVKTMNTDATKPDTDGDGLTDWEEWQLGTNPLIIDTDYDKLTDYEEAKIYLTDPLVQDTDGDRLSDAYEVYTRWDISNVTTTVDEVVIGGKIYNDHTDPLNRDTDGDGLLDGEEGPMGPYYGNTALYNESASDPNPLIYFNGYTHPLDADTDDDSYLQLYNGAIDTQALTFLKDMNDGAEVRGFDIIVFDEEGEPEWKHVITNPCNPDTDGDTGITDRTPQPGAWINSDGYELAQTPPTDPTDGDSDDDGLLDGLEGVLSQFSNHTNPNDPDTDDDDLLDMHEILLGTDPRCADTDLDMIPDGIEFYVFHTNPRLSDSDFDGLSDGEEVYIWHSNPLSDDSDGDRLLDGVEVLRYGSDPMDDDSDNDGLTDFEEIKVYYTNPFEYDSDGDLLSDGEEIILYDTDPLNWDTDMDSITEPNAIGEMTWPMSDYDEIMYYGTDPTKPDSDFDGISDSIELYLSSGIIPWAPMNFTLNPLSKDTDNDGFADGSELLMKNVSQIIYPFVSLTYTLPYNTSPSLADTDFDGLNDYEEVVTYSTSPTLVDTDNDTLSDYDEIMVYNTSALTNDTDGDGLLDTEELLVPMSSSLPSVATGYNGVPMRAAKYNTDPLDWDSDNDYLPDGAEVYLYGSDPLNPDSTDLIPDGVLDGDEFDSDLDGLSDGMEFYIGTQRIYSGGIFNPDSDFDGLLDGDEYYIFGTDPMKADTDSDGFSDGIEITVGTDPLVFTNQSQFNDALALLKGNVNLVIMQPRSDKKVYQNTPVEVANLTSMQEVWYRYKGSNDTEWSNNISCQYDAGSQLWQDKNITWQPGPTEMEVYGRGINGTLYKAYVQFTVNSGNAPNWVLIGGLGGGSTIALATLIFILIKKKKGGK
ncbi:MAG: hypothetical protein K9W44_15925 [Candidatus Lokiarchaeota archaeon]|nr:hypothetical protein [Candidatus Harpocratesius repetitus]